MAFVIQGIENRVVVEIFSAETRRASISSLESVCREESSASYSAL